MALKANLARMDKWVNQVAEGIRDRIESQTGDTFIIDPWQRTDHIGEAGGGGITRIIKSGKVIESGAVNTSTIYGKIDPEFAKTLQAGSDELCAAGVSLIFHPMNPQVPTVHMNFRYIQCGEKEWFGGGADLTPYLPNEDIFRSFHQFWKTKLDHFDETWYPDMKKTCDDYFTIQHRNEMRGIGGIFYDHVEVNDQRWEMVESLSSGFIDCYAEILERCRNLDYNESDKDFQLYRRGRYVEFNLVYDRGTLFGLKTKGRIESILSSLPMNVRFEYNHLPAEGSVYEKMSEYYQPKDWV